MTVSVAVPLQMCGCRRGYMTVLLLAFYQLCTSAVAAAEGAGAAASGWRSWRAPWPLVAPLLALPLRSGGLLWRGDLNNR